MPTLLRRTSVLLASSLVAVAALSIPVIAAGEYLLLARYDGFPGDTFDVRGYGFVSSQPVTVTFEGTTMTATPDGGGNFVTSAFTVPFRVPGYYPVNASQPSSGRTSSINFFVRGYSPWGGPSMYYVLPGQMLGFYGRHFAPNEQVKLFDSSNTLIATFTSDGGGNFDTSNTITSVPFAWRNTTKSYRLVGQTTGAVSNFSVVIGDFYANIVPSTFYIRMNTGMSVEARNFAPNEMIDLYINGTKVDTRTADGGGNTVFGITTPGSGMSFEVKAVGQWSGAMSSRTVILAQPGWGM